MKQQSGNAFVITLISVVLLGALSFILARQMGGTSSQGLSSERAELYANQLIGTAITYQDVIGRMLETGTTMDNLEYMLPSDPAFNTGNTLIKLYHPAGGGMNVPALIPDEMVGTGGFNVVRVGPDSVEWTPTAGTDAVFIAHSLNQSVCSAINKRITGSETIPAWNDGGGGFADLGASGNGLTAANCAGCDGQAMLCILDTITETYGFYAIVAAR